MLLNIDIKQLEWLCAVFLSKDEVGYDEIRSGIDIHSNNQERFGLPARVVAKVFLFRHIFGGSAYAYATDPDFAHVSRSERFWQRVIDAADQKYSGLTDWHVRIVQEVSRTGYLNVCTGRRYKFFREHGEVPKTKVYNYPVQGLGHDLTAILRVSLRNRLNHLTEARKYVNMVSSVHDSILLDLASQVYPLVQFALREAVRSVPQNFQRLFGVPLDLPFRVEVQQGPNWGNMTEVNIDAN